MMPEQGRKDNNIFHTVLMAKFRLVPNESGSAAGLKFVFSNACMTNKYNIVLARFPS